MKVRIVPAYAGWVNISENITGSQLYYRALLGKNRNIVRSLTFPRLKQRLLASGLAQFIINLNPLYANFKFRDYLQANTKSYWILDRIIHELISRLPYALCYDEIHDANINYYVNWHAFKKKTMAKDVVFLTHFEDDKRDEFLRCAKQADFVVCMSKRYFDLLAEEGIHKAMVIPVGIDTTLFCPKLILGYVGGTYSSRKGTDILEKLTKLDWVELRLTEGKLSYAQLPEFYRNLDYVLVPSSIEGGPLCLMEGLACGKEVIIPKDVGAAQEYTQGIIHYEKGNFASLQKVLEILYSQKTAIRKQVESQTWENFAIKHDVLFRELLAKP